MKRNTYRLSQEEARIEILELLNKSNLVYKTDLEFLGFVNNEWIGYKTKIILKCKKHNTINEIPYSSLKRSEHYFCPECIKENVGNRRRFTPEDAEEAIIKKYGGLIFGTLDFSKVKETFTGYTNDVIVICKIHGEFKEKFYSLISKKYNTTCPICRHEKISLTKEEAILNIKNKIIEKNKVLHSDLEFLGLVNDEWVGSGKTKLILKCNKHNIIWKTTSYNNFMKSSSIGCIECKKETTINIHTLTPKQAYDNVVEFYKNKDCDNAKLDFSKILTTFTKTIDKVTVTCPIHGDFQVIYNSLIQNYNRTLCKDCRKDKITKNSLERYTILINKKIDKLKEQGYSIDFLGFCEINTDIIKNTKLLLHCNIHNITWNTTGIDNFINTDGVCCPKCSRYSASSFMENLCRNEVLKYYTEDEISSEFIYLEERDSFYNLSKFIKPDIYLKDKKIIIEYDGEQHYRFIKYFYEDQLDYLRQVRRDKFLEEYCNKNGILLLRIPWVDNKRIPEIIQEFLLNKQDISTKVNPVLPPVII